MKYDYLIVGGGLAGLYTAREILKKKPGAKVIVCEKYKKLGGRAVSYKKDLGGSVGEVQWEIGAGRISTSHKKVLGLIKEYGLHSAPISPGLLYKENGEYQENYFEPSLEILFKPFFDLSQEVLGKKTIQELMMEVYGKKETEKWMNRFPYYSELVYMRADRALAEFQGEFKSHEGFCVCVEGLSELVNHMVADLEKRGCEVCPQMEMIELEKNAVSFRVGSFRDGDARPIQTIEAKKIILALHANALAQIDQFRNWKPLKLVTMQPLCRIYAVFPKKKGKVWFDGIPRVVSPQDLRYFIPINYEKGVAMISYTDSKYAEKYMKIKDDKELERVVMKDLRAVFSDKQIPEPIFFKAHPWTEGVSYWLPGDYSPEEITENVLQPLPKTFPDIYVCGESFSVRQGWMESALEHADLLLKKLHIQ